MDKIILKVNDESVQLNDFVRKIIENIIIALVNSLTLTEKPEKIEITLSKK